MEIDRKEVLRYLGYGKNEADERVAALVEACIEELKQEAEPRHISREFPLKLGALGAIDLTCFQTVSRNLSGNLKDCTGVILFAATLGTGADHLIQKYTRLEMSRAVILQAASAAMIEAYCNEVCSQMRQVYEGQGLFLRPRFSPGYGDFPLSCQSALLDALEAGKRIGIKLTDSLLMMPSKSVSAVIGVSKKPARCDVRGCEVCPKTDCLYRR